MLDKKENANEEEKVSGRELYEWVQALVCSVLTVVVLFTFVARLIGVDGHSMVPTLQDRDRLLVLNSLLYDDYQYGDIVVLRKNTFLDDPIVKRVIATEGQTVDIDFSTGTVWVAASSRSGSVFLWPQADSKSVSPSASAVRRSSRFIRISPFRVVPYSSIATSGGKGKNIS